MSNKDRERWDQKYRRQVPCVEEPSDWLISLRDQLPTRGNALDLAGGAGRNAIWLAGRGLDVTLADISEAALDLARANAAAAHVSIQTLLVDVETDPVPPGPWDLVVCVNFLWRPLFALVPEILRPGGMFVFSQPTRSNLSRHDRPGPRYLLQDGEIPSLVRGLEIVRHTEGWTETVRHEARLLARLPDSVRHSGEQD